jgi:hypothetical protein
MTDVKKTAYLAEAQTALSSDLDGDTNDTYSALSSEFDNSTNGYMFMDIEVYLASADFTTPGGADMAVEIYVVPSVDGTTFPNYQASGTTTSQENNQYFVGSVTVEDVNGAVRASLRGVEIPNGKWKLGVRNVTNRTLAASGNTIKWRPWGYKSA